MLTDNELTMIRNQFISDGYATIRSAFPRDVALDCRRIIFDEMKNDGIFCEDKSTWVLRHGLSKVYTENDGAPWCKVFTSRLKDGVDTICGSGNWNEYGCGWWVVSFPELSEPPWEVDGHWHIDGSWFTHYPFSEEIGLVPVMLFSDVQTHGGGTSVAVGSHKLISKIITSCGYRGCSNTEAAKLALEYDIGEVRELTGQAGDVFLLHPYLLHARSKNLGKQGLDSIRVMCHPSISLKSPKNFSQTHAPLTLLEQSIYHSLDPHFEDLINITKEAVTSFKNKQAARKQRHVDGYNNTHILKKRKNDNDNIINNDSSLRMNDTLYNNSDNTTSSIITKTTTTLLFNEIESKSTCSSNYDLAPENFKDINGNYKNRSNDDDYICSTQEVDEKVDDEYEYHDDEDDDDQYNDNADIAALLGFGSFSGR